MTQLVDPPIVLLLGLSDTGYGTVKSLSQRNLPVIAFEKNATRPETKTNLCQRILYYQDESELLSQIESTCTQLTGRPLLFASGDALVQFIHDHRGRLTEWVDMDFADPETLELLLQKTRFAEFACENGFKVPRTVVVKDQSSLQRCQQELTFPCVVKPAWRSAAWKAARFPKVFVFQNPQELASRFDRIYSVEPELIVQEWVPGDDSDIYFCLTYFDNHSKCLGEFTGRKLRQWPVGTGSTACAEPVDEPSVTQQTMRLFEHVNYRGFGSVEFKRHEKTGEFYIMEPTVGRCNHQSYIATANGVNLPCIAYQSLTGIDLELPHRDPKKVTWIDDQFDALSIIVSLFSGRLNVTHVFRSYAGRKSFRFLSFSDPGPLLHVLMQAPRKLVKYVVKVFSNRMGS